MTSARVWSSYGFYASSGVYSISGSTFDLYVMIAFGVRGWVLRKLDIPLVPVIMGVLLGTLMESNLRRALTISNGDWSIFVSSPLSIGLWTLSIAGFVLPVLVGNYLRAQSFGDERAAHPPAN